MKKIIFFLMLSVCLPSALTAQTAADTVATGSLADRVSFGFKFGLNFPDMHYGSKAINDLSSQISVKGMFELFSEIGLDRKNTISVRPGIKFTTRGQHLDDAGLQYKLNVKYTEIDLPVLYTFDTRKGVNPYVIAGPVLSFAYGGDILLNDMLRQYNVKASKGNVQSTAFGLYFGAGVKCPLAIQGFPFTVGAEIGYHLGLTNTYSTQEKQQTANALNEYDYEINGSRSNRGLEFGLTAAVPLSAFKAIKLPKRQPKPAPVPTSEPVAQPAPEPEKPCYTIDEMKELIRQRKDIRGKKICAIKQVTFEFGKSTLNRNDKVYLDEIVNLMKQNGQISVKINGHTDNIGSEQFNMNLSRDRAKAVYDYLTGKGISASRLSYEYFGHSRPIADNETDDGRAINRRVEFEIINQ